MTEFFAKVLKRFLSLGLVAILSLILQAHNWLVNPIFFNGSWWWPSSARCCPIDDKVYSQVLTPLTQSELLELTPTPLPQGLIVRARQELGKHHKWWLVAPEPDIRKLICPDSTLFVSPDPIRVELCIFQNTL